jgi:predicted enzyme related to lactoylglutathione lyase
LSNKKIIKVLPYRLSLKDEFRSHSAIESEGNEMAKALGVGGVFFKSPDPTRLQKWYAQWLGIEGQDGQGMAFAIFQPENMPQNSYTVWSLFDSGSDYFAPSRKDFMFNLIVDHLEEALQQVAAGGAQVVGEIEKSDYGDFGWFIDPDGNKVELWQPPVA